MPPTESWNDTDALAALLHENDIGCEWGEGLWSDPLSSHRDDAARLGAAGVRVGGDPQPLANLESTAALREAAQAVVAYVLDAEYVRGDRLDELVVALRAALRGDTE